MHLLSDPEADFVDLGSGFYDTRGVARNGANVEAASSRKCFAVNCEPVAPPVCWTRSRSVPRD